MIRALVPKVFAVLTGPARVARSAADASSVAKVTGSRDAAAFRVGGSLRQLPVDHDTIPDCVLIGAVN